MENLLQQIKKINFKNLDVDNLILIIMTIEEIGLTKRNHSKMTIYLHDTLKELFNSIYDSINEFKSTPFTSINNDDLNLLLDYFPDERFINIVDKYGINYRFTILNKATKIYLLGLPIDMIDINNLDEKELNKELIEKKYDIEAHIKKCNKQDLKKILNYSFITKTSQDMDSVHKSQIDSFISFDVIRYVQNNRLFTIVRSEFDYILKKRHNPWNFTCLPSYVFEEIERREKIVKELKLPTCYPWPYIYNFCMKGFDFEENESLLVSSEILDNYEKDDKEESKLCQSDCFLEKKYKL